MPLKKRVVISSPFSTFQPAIERTHLYYLDRCLEDSVICSEAPYASHKTVKLAIERVIPEEPADILVTRRWAHGVVHALSWIAGADLVAAYVDHGISGGMTVELWAAVRFGIPVEFRMFEPRKSVHFSPQRLALVPAVLEVRNPKLTEAIGSTHHKVELGEHMDLLAYLETRAVTEAIEAAIPGASAAVSGVNG